MERRAAASTSRVLQGVGKACHPPVVYLEVHSPIVALD
jgi:hypothetical protein